MLRSYAGKITADHGLTKQCGGEFLPFMLKRAESLDIVVAVCLYLICGAPYQNIYDILHEINVEKQYTWKVSGDTIFITDKRKGVR